MEGLALMHALGDRWELAAQLYEQARFARRRATTDDLLKWAPRATKSWVFRGRAVIGWLGTSGPFVSFMYMPKGCCPRQLCDHFTRGSHGSRDLRNCGVNDNSIERGRCSLCSFAVDDRALPSGAKSSVVDLARKAVCCVACACIGHGVLVRHLASGFVACDDGSAAVRLLVR
eukprot:613120-Pleurochrysis_carterae.AAC.1